MNHESGTFRNEFVCNDFCKNRGNLQKYIWRDPVPPAHAPAHHPPPRLILDYLGGGKSQNKNFDDRISTIFTLSGAWAGGAGSGRYFLPPNKFSVHCVLFHIAPVCNFLLCFVS